MKIPEAIEKASLSKYQIWGRNNKRKPRASCLICGTEVRHRNNKMCSISCSNRYKYQDPSKHPSWRGGKANRLLHVRNANWRPLQQWRAKVLERDGYACVLCGASDTKLQADHIKPFAFFPNLRLELSNGRTLCVPCHKATPTYGRRGEKLYKDALASGKPLEQFFETL